MWKYKKKYLLVIMVCLLVCSTLSGCGNKSLEEGLELLESGDYEASVDKFKEAAEKWNLSVRRVQTICNEGMIQGTIKFGHAWAIPKDAEKPADKRIKTKKYMKR